MSYFSNFPTTGYIVDTKKAKIVTAKNILVRAKFSDYIKTNESLIMHYRIREEDRPDTIANIVYGRPDLHWIILLFNEIINPYHQWPKTQAQMEEFINLIYPGTTLYIRDNSILYEYGTIPPNIPFFEKGTKIYQYNNTYNANVVATVVSYNSNLGQLVVDDIQWDSDITDEPKFRTTTTETNGSTVLGSTIRTTNSLGNGITAVITKSELTPYAVHHFEEDGIILDPRCKYEPLNGTNGVKYRPYSDIPKSTINLYSDPSVDQTGNTIGEGLIVAKQAISYMQYEYSENEKLREIKILRPTFLDEVLKQFGNLFRV